MMTQTLLTQEQLGHLQQQADEFSKTFANAQYEMGEAQKFINALCMVYGVNWLHSVDFERRVKKANRRGINRIDGFLPSLLLIEMKSAGEDLDKAFEQALHYVQLLEKESDKPRHILVSDFQNLHLYELNDRFTTELPDKTVKFTLADFRANVEALAFMGGYERIIAERNEALTIAAAEKLAALHDAFLSEGYSGKDLQTMLVRLLFCLFADDTELFDETNVFENFIKNSPADGADLGYRLQDLFEWLNTNDTERKQTAKPLWEEHHGFRKSLPYINGKLFAEKTQRFIFNSTMRTALIDCCELDWGEISPDIFGTLFQNIMESADNQKDKKSGKKSQHRRDFGAHYTSERNIRRAIEPIFLNDLKAEFEQVQNDAKKLTAFITKLQTLQILDPACGCGNFLIVAYREMRLLEMQALKALDLQSGQQMSSYCDVHQFHGFEIDSAACEIATVAMWLTDHQMNRRYQEGYRRIPLANRADIHCINALSQDWATILGETTAKNIRYIVGNPPFLGKTYQSASQKEDMKRIAGNIKNFASLDYVCGWYIQAVKFMQQFTNVQTAFVSTNSITQGEQVAILWQPLLDAGLHIRFAHRTFKWSNEGSGVAAVHCVIIGFSLMKPKLGFRGQIWDYSDDIAAEKGKCFTVKRINPYLLEADNFLVTKRTKQISNEKEIVNGGKPVDGGFLLLDDEEKRELLLKEPQAEKYIMRFSMGDEFINNIPRWCLWFADVDEIELQNFLENSPLIKARIEKVKEMRLLSTKAATQKLAEKPHLFAEVRTSKTECLAIPKVSSENRQHIPIGFLNNTICGDKLFFMPDATLYHFGILCSTMHNAFMRTVAGRLKSDYSYSNTIVYNNFPFPNVDEEAKTTIGEYAQAILDARKAHPKMTLAQLYNPETMPMNLKQAHAALDDVIDDAYGYTSGNSDAQRVAFLFELLK